MSTSAELAALPVPWTDQALPATWPDQQQNLLRLAGWFMTAPVRRELAEVPGQLVLNRSLPDYVREPFHGLPNGYYSLGLVEGYDRGFELSMLGRTSAARRNIAERLRGAERTLDVGCGSGRLAHAMLDAGVREVWALDPSPYMLRCARRRAPEVHALQGLIEDTQFPDECFDGAGAFFVFHELPRQVASSALHELHRILRPSGLLCITEPSEAHIRPKNLWRLVRDHGVRALYFHLLAKLVYEPFLADWQSVRDRGAWLFEHGFELVEDDVRVPFRSLVARKR